MAAPDAPSPGGRLFLRVFPSIMLPMFLASVDGTIVAAALPAIAAEMGEVERVSWIVVAFLVAATIAIPVQAYVIWIAPQLQEMGQPHGEWLVAVSRFIGRWWWPALPVALAIATVVLTRRLAARWTALCAALKA